MNCGIGHLLNISPENDPAAQEEQLVLAVAVSVPENFPASHDLQI
jgi:hypothetical protein